MHQSYAPFIWYLNSIWYENGYSCYIVVIFITKLGQFLVNFILRIFIYVTLLLRVRFEFMYTSLQDVSKKNIFHRLISLSSLLSQVVLQNRTVYYLHSHAPGIYRHSELRGPVMRTWDNTAQGTAAPMATPCYQRSQGPDTPPYTQLLRCSACYTSRII